MIISKKISLTSESYLDFPTIHYLSKFLSKFVLTELRDAPPLVHHPSVLDIRGHAQSFSVLFCISAQTYMLSNCLTLIPVCLSVCPPMPLPICLTVCLSIRAPNPLPICLTYCLSIHVLVTLPMCLTVCLSVCPPVSQPIGYLSPAACLFIHLSCLYTFCLSIYPPVPLPIMSHCLPVRSSTHPSDYMSHRLPVSSCPHHSAYINIYLSVHLNIPLPICCTVCLSVRPPIPLSLCLTVVLPSICRPVHPSACLSAHPSICVLADFSVLAFNLYTNFFNVLYLQAEARHLSIKLSNNPNVHPSFCLSWVSPSVYPSLCLAVCLFIPLSAVNLFIPLPIRLSLHCSFTKKTALLCFPTLI